MWEQTQRIFLDSVARVLHAIARITPGLLAMFLIVALTVAVALALRTGVRRLCERLGVDHRLREWGLVAPASEGHTPPSKLVARFVGWTVLAFGFVAGLSAVDAATTSMLAARLLDYMPHVLVAAVILAIGIAGSRGVERGVLITAVNMGFPSARLVGRCARWLTVLLAVAIALEDLGIGGRVVPVAFGILFGGFVLTLALAVGLGSRGAVERALGKHFAGGPHRLDDAPEEDRIRHL